MPPSAGHHIQCTGNASGILDGINDSCHTHTGHAGQQANQNVNSQRNAGLRQNRGHREDSCAAQCHFAYRGRHTHGDAYRDQRACLEFEQQQFDGQHDGGDGRIEDGRHPGRRRGSEQGFALIWRDVQQLSQQ
jgi:hypothetical protein